MIRRSKQEIEDVLAWAGDGIMEGSKFPGMSYEDGVEAALAWAIGEREDRPDAE